MHPKDLATYTKSPPTRGLTKPDASLSLERAGAGPNSNERGTGRSNLKWDANAPPARPLAEVLGMVMECYDKFFLRGTYMRFR